MIDGEDFKHWVKGVRRVSGAGGGAGGAWDCGDGDCWVAGCVVKEAKERVLASLYAFGCDVFDKRLVVHLSPPERKKHSPMFDLAMAIGILKAIGKLTAPVSSDAAFLGSLSLDERFSRWMACFQRYWRQRSLVFKKYTFRMIPHFRFII